MNTCHACHHWRPLTDTEFGTCYRAPVPAVPIDGAPASAVPFRRGDATCPAFIPHPDALVAAQRGHSVAASLARQA